MRALVYVLLAVAALAAAWLWADEAFGKAVAPPPAAPRDVAAPAPTSAARAAGPGEGAPAQDAPRPSPIGLHTERDSEPHRESDSGPAAPPAAPFEVVDDAGAPIAGAIVTAVDGERDLASVVTDLRGEVQVRDVPDAFDFQVTARGFLPQRGHRAATEARTRVVLAAAPRLHGRVFDAAGKPIAGARAVLLPVVAGRLVPPPALPPHTPEAWTDADGRFLVPWPDTAPRDLVVTANGFAPCVAAALSAERQGETAFAVTLFDGAFVVGTARDPAGTPLANVGVELWWTGSSTVPRSVSAVPWPEGRLLAQTTTAADGSFAFRDLPACDLAVVGLLPTHGGSSWRGPLLHGAGAEVELVAATAASVRGTVRGARPGAVVFFYEGPRFLRTAAVATDGSFALDDLPPGRYLVGTAVPPVGDTLHLAVQARITGRGPDLATEIDLAPGERRELALTAPATTTGVAVGTAVVGGRPAVAHRVVLRSVTGEGAWVRRTVVAEDGSFACADLQPGDYDVELCATDDARPLATQGCRVFAGQATRVTLIAP